MHHDVLHAPHALFITRGARLCAIFTFLTIHENDGTVKFSVSCKLYHIATYVTIHE